MPFTNYPNGITSMGVPVVPGLGAGVGLGDVYWVVTSKDSTSPWYEKIRSRSKDANIFSSLQAAHDACTSGQSDTIFVTPGLYTTTSQTNFTKSHIIVIGTGGPNNGIQVAATIASSDQHGSTIYCDTASVAHTMLITGHRNQFYNMSFVNSGANTANLSAVKIGGVTTKTAYGNYFNRCTFHGCMDTAQNTCESSCVQIGSGSSDYMFEDCIIGQNTWGGDRATLYQGLVYYSGNLDSGAAAGIACQNGIWKNCMFRSRTAAATIVPAIRIGDHSCAHNSAVGDESWDRSHFWINCTFDNWGSLAIPTVFYNCNASGAGVARLYNCAAYNYAEWRVVYGAQVGEGVGNILTNMGIPVAADPGIAIEATS
jgi:hypothetical protein